MSGINFRALAEAFHQAPVSDALEAASKTPSMFLGLAKEKIEEALRNAHWKPSQSYSLLDHYLHLHRWQTQNCSLRPVMACTFPSRVLPSGDSVHFYMLDFPSPCIVQDNTAALCIRRRKGEMVVADAVDLCSNQGGVSRPVTVSSPVPVLRFRGMVKSVLGDFGFSMNERGEIQRWELRLVLGVPTLNLSDPLMGISQKEKAKFLNSFVLTPDGKKLLMGFAFDCERRSVLEQLLYWNMETGKAGEIEKNVSSFIVTPDSQRVLIGGAGGGLTIRNLETLEMINTLPDLVIEPWKEVDSGPLAVADAFALSPDGQHIVVTTTKQQLLHEDDENSDSISVMDVSVWNLSRRQEVSKLAFPEGREFHRIYFSQDGKNIFIPFTRVETFGGVEDLEVGVQVLSWDAAEQRVVL